MILRYQVEKSAPGSAILYLQKEANNKYNPEQVTFLTDRGSKNVNTKVSDFISQEYIPIEHIVTQKDVAFSNTMIKALNKVIKHQFLYPNHPNNLSSLLLTLKKLFIATTPNAHKLLLAEILLLKPNKAYKLILGI